VLAQLPPSWRRDLARLEGFLAAFPRRRRLAVEFRDRDWLAAPTYALLRRYGAALCINDLVHDHPRVVTADHVYLRFHGPDPARRYRGAYSHQMLSGLAQRIRRHLADGLDVHVYFDNDAAGQAVLDARRLIRFLRDEI
jgi:uncharacterized protein YecE (DUF72 family)